MVMAVLPMSMVKIIAVSPCFPFLLSLLSSL